MKAIVGLSCWVLGALQSVILILVPIMMEQGQLAAWMIAIPFSLGTFIFVVGSGYWGRWLDRCVAKKRPLSGILTLILFGFALSQLSFLVLLESRQLIGIDLIIGLCFVAAIIVLALLLSCLMLCKLPTKKDAESLLVTNYIFLDSSAHKNIKLIGSTVIVTAFLITLFSSQLQFSLGPLLSNGLMTAAQASAMVAKLLLSASVSVLFSLFVLYKLLIRSTPFFLVFITVSFSIGTLLFVMQTQLILRVMLISSALAMAPAWFTAVAMRSTDNQKAQVSASISQGHTLGNAFGALLVGLLLAWDSHYLFPGLVILMLLIVLGWSRLYQQSTRLNHAAVNLPRQSVIEK